MHTNVRKGLERILIKNKSSEFTTGALPGAFDPMGWVEFICFRPSEVYLLREQVIFYSSGQGKMLSDCIAVKR